MDKTRTNKENRFFTKSNMVNVIFPYFSMTKKIKNKAVSANFLPSFNIYFFFLFCVITSFLFLNSAEAAQVANEILKTNQDSIFANIVAYINPDVVDSPELNETFAHQDIGIYLSMIGVFANKAALSLFFVGFLWFGSKSAIDRVFGVTNQSAIIKTAVFSFFIFMSMPYSTFTSKIHDTYAEKNMFQYYFDKAIYNTVVVADNVAATNMNNSISIPSFKVVSPKNISDDFLKVINAYVLGYQDTDKENESINIEYKSNVYRIEFDMGGSTTKITTNSSVALNEQSDLLNINLLEKEKIFIKSYVEHLFNTAVKVGKKIENIDFSYLMQQTGDIQDFENSKDLHLAFNEDYKNYCNNLYDYSLAGSDQKTIQRYFEIVSLCEATNFLTENYQNEFYSVESVYNNTSPLRNNNAFIFGENILTANYDDILEYTNKVCKGGYLACVEAVQFTTIHNIEERKDLGVLAIPVGIVNELIGSVYDTSDRILKVRKISQEPSQIIQFKDKVLPENALYSVPFTLHHQKNNGLIYDTFDLYDFNKIDLPSFEDILGTMTGGDITTQFERVKTCFRKTDEVYNGFNCNSPTKEVLDFGTGMIKTGAAIYLSNQAILLNKSSKLSGGVAVGSKLGNKLSKSATGIVAVLIPEIFTNDTKNDPYYSKDTVQGIVLLSFIVSFFNSVFASALASAAMLLMLSGIGIIVLVYGFYFQIFLLFVATLIELIIDSKVLMIKIYSSVINDGVEGCGAVFKEMIAELVFLIFLIFMMNDMAYIVDILLLSQLEQIFSTVDAMKGSIETILIGLPQLFIAIVVQVVILILVNSFLTGLLQRILEQVKK
ncbi:hypothetical protein [Psychromonas aquatilis]|uniref:TrbL/VirB6 plasmid conjugal transfer protein n=1 Tax=Psychromonas aquatilis TaxID=2005072 RepID=A0ABU9GRI0_9GAMM